MPHRDAPEICRKIDAALDFMGDADEFRPYLMYQIDQVLGGPDHIRMEDCTTSELTSLLAVVLPIFARCLSGVLPASPQEGGGKLLTLILGDAGVDYSASTGT